MSFAGSLSEVSVTFPGRDILIAEKPNQAEWVGIRDAICPVCGKTYAYAPGYHVYTRRFFKNKKERRLHFCSWSCMRTYDECHPSKIDRMIREKRAKLDYLLEQKELPQSERTVKGDLSRLIERADVEYNRAITRKIWEAV